MAMTITAAMNATVEPIGRTLKELSEDGPVLLAFLRHLGCMFCREAIADIARQRSSIERAGVRIVLVHMTPDEAIRPLLQRHGIADLGCVSSVSGSLHAAYGLERGSIGKLFGPAVWRRGLAAFLQGHGVGRLQGDGFRMPGLFLIERGMIVRAYRHAHAGDRPDYAGIACAAGRSVQ